MGLPQSCNVSRTETYHVQIVFNVFKKGMCTWRKLRKKTWGTYSQFSTCLKYSPTMGNPLVHRKSPNVLLWNVSSLALTCRTLKTSADQTEPQFVSAWQGEMWKKQNGGEVPKCWKCMKCWLLLLIVDLGTCPCKFLWKDRHCKCKALKFSSRGLRLIPCGCMLSYFQVGTRKTVWPFWENTHQLLVPKTVAAGATVYNFCSNPFYVFIYVAHWIYPFIIIQWIYPFVIRILSNPLIFIVAHIFEFFAKTNRTVVKPFKRASSRPPEEMPQQRPRPCTGSVGASEQKQKQVSNGLIWGESDERTKFFPQNSVVSCDNSFNQFWKNDSHW